MQSSPAATDRLRRPVLEGADARFRTATASDIGRCLESLRVAFEQDPACRWFWPDTQQYRSAFPRFAWAFGGAAFDSETAYCYGEFAGVALWLPPGVGPDENALERLMPETVNPDQLDAAYSFFDQMAKFHPSEPHWYLPLIGVRPEWQNHGVGSALQRHVLRHCDREGLPAYLEATSPRNVALYERLGFEALGTISVPGCPPVTPMLRTPK